MLGGVCTVYVGVYAYMDAYTVTPYITLFLLNYLALNIRVYVRVSAHPYIHHSSILFGFNHRIIKFFELICVLYINRFLNRFIDVIIRAIFDQIAVNVIRNV